ncbi:MAG TPA: hypothetical protein VG291_00690 [Xanthobacteraceae bacterium]|nr:hypothetical protein [Xanthobacteraceae bacterium]
MKADYATSDLISKVNSDWINAVLVNHDLDCADPGDDEVVTDLMLRPQFSGTQSSPRWREPAPAPAKSAEVDDREPGSVAQPMVQSSRCRSVARRVTERLALAVAALALAGAGFRMSPGAQDVTNPVSVQAASASFELTAPINADELQPGWLLPEILYGPTMASSPISAPRSRR